MAASNQSDDGAKLKDLEARIKAAKGEQEPNGPAEEDHYSQAQAAWRMVTELVAGLGIGFGIGFGLDRLFGTTPFLMILFLFLGLAAGIKTMIRTAQEVQTKYDPGTSRDDEGT
ncbi:MAG: AtpZ/AtpI family protein [Pseudomonadota bacterium]